MRKTALITGAAKRIGRAIALDLAANDWQVAIHYRRAEQDAVALKSEIVENGGAADIVQADLGDQSAPAQLIEKCSKYLSSPLCLINNAATFKYDDIESLSAESWDAHLSANLRAPIFLAQAFANALPQGQQGNIINIIDQRVWKLTPQYFSYTISKSALWTATQTLAQSLAPHIRVNAIGPGPVLKSTNQDDEQFETQQKATLLERGTTTEEIAQTVRFILNSPALTGQLIALDGGQHLAWQTPDVVGVD